MLTEGTKARINAIEINSGLAEDRFRYRYKFYSPSTLLLNAKSGDENSLIVLAYVLWEGFLVAKDVELGKDILEEMAVHSNFAKLELSWSYHRVGDFQSALDLVQNLDKSNYLPATFRLMALHKNGIGTPRDVSKYNFYLKKALKGGHVQAKKELCRLKMGNNSLLERAVGAVHFIYLNLLMLFYFMIDRNHEKIIS